MQDKDVLTGRAAIESLARRFPQLYVAPAEGAREAHKLAAGRGIAPENATLDHFVCSDADELRTVETPAGEVETLFLSNRADFETFLQIIGHRCSPDPIARTIGAMTYRGIADWQQVEDARREYVASGGTDWPTEFARLARIPGTFRAELIIISEGPYSNIPSRDTPYDADEWLRISKEIRLHHECAHVVCRRLMPDDILPVWDEITADVVGLLCACGAYDASLADRFLGVERNGYCGGRFAEYLNEDQLAGIDGLACEVYAATEAIEKMAHERNAAANPFDFLLELKREPLVSY